MKPTLFIGSSTEQVHFANAVQANLDDVAQGTVWTQSVCAPSEYTLESLLKSASETDFAVFVCVGDDITRLRGRDYKTVRDNLIFELGLFMNRLGRERTFLLVPKEQRTDLHLPIDVLGLTAIYFEMDRADRRWRAALGPACDMLRARIQDLGPRQPRSITDPDQDYISYLVASTRSTCIVLAHCANSKKLLEEAGIAAPGHTLIHHIDDIVIRAGKSWRHELRDVKPGKTPDWRTLNDVDALFVVDSPQYNGYARDLIDNYWKYVTGGKIGHAILEKAGGPPTQTISVGPTAYESNKYAGASPHETRSAFGHFDDYLVVMRLPRAVAGRPHLRNQKPQVVWVVYGITAKGSHAGANLFRKDNFAKFEAFLWANRDTVVPPYFEAVFRIPAHRPRVEDFDDFVCEHFAALRLKADPCPRPPADIAAGALDRAPVLSVHLDPVAACNLNCPHCIEPDVRSKNLCLTTGRICGILADLRELGCQDLRFYGGEPTLHPEFARIVRVAAWMGFDMLVVTNGSLLTDAEIARALIATRRNLHLRVSLDANTQNTYESNHGPTAARPGFETIRRSIVGLIGSGVPVRISYLLTDESIPELPGACAYWKEKGASSFEPRYPMAVHGEWQTHPWKDGAEQLCQAHLRTIFHQYGAWVDAPDWFRKWSQDGSRPETEKKFDRCYSGYYRFGISPYARETDDLPVIQSRCATRLRATEEAWISLCLYYRYDKKFGCEYPPDLAKWCAEGRIQTLDLIRPKEGICAGTICSRAEENESASRRALRESDSTRA